MDSSFACKLYKNEEFLGTAFLIRTNILYTANHCFEDIHEFSTCYIECKQKKYYISEVKKVDELDLAQITLKSNVEGIDTPEISTECIYTGEILCGYGYKKVNKSVQGVHMKLEEYPLEISNSEKADVSFTIENEEDGARWKGISGGPVYSEKLLRGMIIKHHGGDGLSTRIKVISFNKIINHLVDNNMDELIENFPQRFVDSELHKRMDSNRKKCEKLYYSSNYTYECENVELVINFFKVQDEITMKLVSKELSKSIIGYALSLEEKYSGTNYMDEDKIQKINDRINEVTERMNGNFNSVYIMLWMLTEGIIEAPRIARVLVKQGSKYIEEDIYLKKRDGKITLLIPVIAVNQNIFNSIFNIIRAVNIKKDNDFVKLNDIEWDEQAIKCLDIKSSVEIGKIIRNKYNNEVKIEITALVLYNSGLYSNIPQIINTEERIKQFFHDNFKKDFNNELQEYKILIDKINEINDIKINLFVLPITDVNSIENI